MISEPAHVISLITGNCQDRLEELRQKHNRALEDKDKSGGENDADTETRG